MKLKSVLRILAGPTLLWTAPAFILLSPMAFGPVRCAAAEVVEEEGAEVLTRGPVHEGFAETVVFKPVQGIMVPKAPPGAIEELPPDQRPEGENVTWIPGYWAWEDEGNEFLWVSGIWRNLPPGRQWVPGYWQDADQEYQWVSGYWADAEAEEIEYLPEPPASVEAGPNIDRPSEDSIWISGSWRWNENRYRWRPGYWDAAQTDWVWVPAHYIWTRRGHIFVDGYWDYSVARRGMIFAPVRFREDHYSRPNYSYRPSVVLSLALFTDHLFLRPRSRHYYFGDYYDPRYRRSGYYASHTYFSGRHGYDPIFAHQRWIHRNDNRWERRRDENFRFFRDNREERPPHTFAALAKFAARPESTRRFDRSFATPLTQFVSNKESTVKFKPVNEEEKQRFAGRGREIREFGEQRKQLAKSAVAADTAQPGTAEPGKGPKGKDLVVKEPVREKFRRSPIVAKTTENPAQTDTPPPKRPEVTAPTDNTDPKTTDQPVPPRGKGKMIPGRGDKPPTDQPGTSPDEQPGKKPKEQPGDVPPRGSKVKPQTPPTGEPEGPLVDRPKEDTGVGPKVPPKGEPEGPLVDRPKEDTGVGPKVPTEGGRKIVPGDSPKPEPTPEPKVGPTDPPKRGPRIEPKPEPTPEPKVGPTDPPKRGPRGEPKPVPTPEPKVGPTDPPKRGPRVEPKPEPTPKPEPKVEPKAPPVREPRVEPRRGPKTEPPPTREPRVEPKAPPSRPEPRVEPKAPPSRPEPRVEPKAPPPSRPEPRVAPPAQPKAPPSKPEPRKNPKDDSEEKKGKR